ncbi:hypothetical protein ACRRTK_009759 [Alexandromys fortis]
MKLSSQSLLLKRKETFCQLHSSSQEATCLIIVTSQCGWRVYNKSGSEGYLAE